MDRPVGIAVFHQTNDGTEYSLEGGSSGATNAGSASFQEVSMAIETTDGPPNFDRECGFGAYR